MKNFKTNPFLKKGYNNRPSYEAVTPVEYQPTSAPLIVSDSVLDDNDEKEIINNQENQEENNEIEASAAIEMQNSDNDKEQLNILPELVFEPESIRPQVLHIEPANKSNYDHDFIANQSSEYNIEPKTISKESTSLIDDIKRMK